MPPDLKTYLCILFQRKAHEKEDWELSLQSFSTVFLNLGFREKLMKKRIESYGVALTIAEEGDPFQRKAHEKEDWEAITYY